MPDITTTYCTRWLITLADATVSGYTDHDQDITVAAQLYKSAIGYVPSAVQTSVELSPDNMDVMGIIDDAGIKEADLLAGRYDYAEIEVAVVDYTNLAGGDVYPLVRGKLGRVSIASGQFQAELNSLAMQLQQNIGRIISPLCDADLGDTKCGITLLPATWEASKQYEIGDVIRATVYDGRRYVCTTAGTSNDTEGEPTWDTVIGNTTTETDGVVWTCADAYTKNVTVTSVTDKRNIEATALTDATGYFDGGLLTWSAGSANEGYVMDVKAYVLSVSPAQGEIELYEPMPYTPAVSDTATITVGCDKLDTTCLNTYANLDNFRGFPHIPGLQKLMEGP